MSFRAILDEHIGTSPPSTVDVDRIIRRERRGRLMRRIGVGGAAAVMTALAITAGVALTGGPYWAPASKPGNVASAASPQASVSPSPAGSHIPAGDAQAILATRARLQTALEQALIDVAPDAGWIYMPDVPGETPLPDGHPKVWVENGARVGFAARAGLSRHGAKAGFYLWLRPAGCFSSDGRSICSLELKCRDGDKPADCTSWTTPGGLPVVETTETSAAKGGKQYRFYNVQVLLPNDYRLTLLAVNYFGGDGSPVSSQTPLLSKTELKAMALVIADRMSG